MEISSIIKWSKRELKSGKGVVCEMTRTVPTQREKDIISNAVNVERIKSSHGECSFSSLFFLSEL